MKRSLLMIISMFAFAITGVAQIKGDLPLPASGEVTLQLEEYNKLIELASKPAIKPESPPVPFAIKRAALRLRVTSESVIGTMQCDGEIFAKGVTRIPLLMGPAILDARQAGKSVPLEQLGRMQTAVLSGPSEFSIMLDTGLPLIIEAGRASFNLPVPAAGSAQLLLEIPGEHTNVKINQGLITRRSTENGQTTVEATLVPGQSVNVWWTTRELMAPIAPREVRFLSDIKTLASIGEADVRLAILATITVIQGDPAQFEVEMPPGYEMSSVTGASLESEKIASGSLIISVDNPGKRSHQFLISLEKANAAAKTDIPILSFKGTQRETGEVLVDGEGTMELRAKEGGVLKRIDIKEVNSYLRALARSPLHAAFRYHRQSSEPPSLTLDWNRFPDSHVLAAAAENAEVTTLVTSEGRSLTEVKLTVKNQAQPFLKVGLPVGASILTADVAGEKVKPVQGTDGMRVPLLRLGFRPSGAYLVTFVFVHAGAPFDKKGDSELSLPKMDIPIHLLQWEVFLPERYKVKNFGGDAIAANLLPPVPANDVMDLINIMGGVVKAETPIFGNNTQTFAGVSAGNVNLQRDGITVNEVRYNSGIVSPVDAEMGRGAGQTQIGSKRNEPSSTGSASSNVVNLQRRAAGVLPIHVDVPRAGNSYRFLRPLVLDEETKMTFKYNRK